MEGPGRIFVSEWERTNPVKDDDIVGCVDGRPLVRREDTSRSSKNLLYSIFKVRTHTLPVFSVTTVRHPPSLDEFLLDLYPFLN